MASPKARLSPRAALVALAAILLAGLAIVLYSVARAPVSSSTFASGHDHGSASTTAVATPEERARADEHTNLCFDGGGIAGTDDDGACPAGSFNVGTPPMLQVWVVPNPDGPFAAIDEAGIVGTEG